MMTFVICDGSETESRFIEEYLYRFVGPDEEDVLIFHFSKGADIEEYLTVSPDAPDVAIISTALKSPDGFALAETLSRAYPKMRIVLIGRDAGDVERLFENGVAYFMYSPLSTERFRRFTVRIRKAVCGEEKKYLRLANKKGVASIDMAEILYVMSDKRKIIVYQPHGKTDEVYMKLDQVEESLDTRFVRCHQSYLVNMDYIHGITTEGFTLIGDTLIPISQNRYWASKRQYIDYIKSRG